MKGQQMFVAAIAVSAVALTAGGTYVDLAGHGNTAWAATAQLSAPAAAPATIPSFAPTRHADPAGRSHRAARGVR